MKAVAMTGLLWVGIAGGLAFAQSQPTAPGLEADVVFRAWQADGSVAGCGVCHYSPGNQFAKRNTDFCRLTEVEQWLKNDKHAIARQRVEPIAPEEQTQAVERMRGRLSGGGQVPVQIPQNWISASNFLSFAICQRLGYDVKTEEGYARFRKNCLTCHGGIESSNASDQSPSDDATRPGINCNYCHQLGTDSRWIDQHSGSEAQRTWRTLAPSAKAELGMRDLVSPRAQAQLCYRCHIGDLQHNMFVTHAMYAAGHPPLPGVELGTLVEAMPLHWHSPKERHAQLSHDPQRRAYFEVNFPALAAALDEPMAIEMYPWRTATLVGGALAARQQAVRLIAEAAEPSSSHWGDYALYDCAACHHDLRVPSVRQSVRQPGAPGRPRLPEWPEVLARAVEITLGGDPALATSSARLTQAVRERPFGDRAAVARAASAVDGALEQLQRRLADHRLTANFCHELLAALMDTPDEALVDYQSARQINWAIRCLDAELEQLGQPLDRGTRTAISNLGLSAEPAPAAQKTAEPATTAEPAATPAVGRTRISSDLPGGLVRAIYPEFLAQELARQANYDAAAFIQQLRSCKPAAFPPRNPLR